ncbi:MAG: permease, partial [Paraglaciecola sp.]|nr:permease [Paraglaciecola sp.]
MLSIFTELADWFTYTLLGLSANDKLSDALHFFIEDTSKIFFLLVVMIYLIALVRASLNIEKVRDYLASKNRFVGYFFGAIFGAITPFCSCSSIPVFLGFTSAGIPVGITMAFLLSSPLINEVAVLLLLSLVGWKLTLIYILVGMAVGIVGGILLDLIHAEKMLQPFALKAYHSANPVTRIDKRCTATLTFRQRHDFAKQELLDIVRRVWVWIFVGVGIG